MSPTQASSPWMWGGESLGTWRDASRYADKDIPQYFTVSRLPSSSWWSVSWHSSTRIPLSPLTQNLMVSMLNRLHEKVKQPGLAGELFTIIIDILMPLSSTCRKLPFFSALLNWNIPHHHSRFMALFPGPPLWAGARRELTLWCKGRSMEADTQTIRLGATPSRLTSAHLHHPHFFTGQMPLLPPNQQSQSTEGNKLKYMYIVDSASI